MKYFIFLFVFTFLSSCSVNEAELNGNNEVSYLTNGKWIVSEFEGKEDIYSRGIVFSKDNQFFQLDSQGRIIPRNHKVIFELKSDTLKVIDYNYEATHIEEKGMKVFIVEELDEEELVLKCIYPDSTSNYKFRKEEL